MPQIIESGDESFDKLNSEGDPFEVLICRDVSSLQLILYPYARIWAKHVYPRRIGDGAYLTKNWQGFGGFHYTALVRLHQAMKAKDELIHCCENGLGGGDDYGQLLIIQSLCANYWDNLGASIDNFIHAKNEAKKLLNTEFSKRPKGDKCDACGQNLDYDQRVARTLSQTENPRLYYAFERRHQYIHSVLVPIQIEDGMVCFNLRHYDDAKTSWTQERMEYDLLHTKIEKDWEAILDEYANSWECLYSWLQTHDMELVEYEKNTKTDESSNLYTVSLRQRPLSGSGEMDVPPSGSGFCYS